MKPVLMIHEILEWMFELPLQNYILTFDDGLYSQYYFLDKFKEIKTEKIFFISTEIICEENVSQSSEFQDCRSAHHSYFTKKCKDQYMKWSQIKEIAKTPQCFIGGHSHSHRQVYNYKLKELYDFLLSDTRKMVEAFRSQGMSVSKFCYPYNEAHLLYEEILKKEGFTEFFGKERIAIESLRSA